VSERQWTDDEIEALVAPIGAKREVYGVCKGVREAAVLVRDMAVEAFLEGSAERAELLREVSIKLEIFSEAEVERFRGVNDKSAWRAREAALRDSPPLT